MKTSTKLLIGLVVLFTIGGVALQAFTLLQPKEVVAIRVVVAPNLFDWADANAQTFNARNDDAQVTVTSLGGVNALDELVSTGGEMLPQAWIPEATFVAMIAQDQGLPYEAAGQSITSTDLLWGTFSSREAVLSNQFGVPLDWGVVHDSAVADGWGDLGGDANWGYFKLTIASPTRTTEGLAALISAAATYYSDANLTANHINDAIFLTWLQEVVSSVPNFNTLGTEPAKSMATRGPSVGDAGFLSAAAWSRSESGLNNWEEFVLSEPTYTVRLDYPYILRNNLETEAERDVAQRFGDFLVKNAAQLAEQGFEQQETHATLIEVDAQAALALLHWAEREGVGQ